MTIELDEGARAWLDGAEGMAMQLAMRLILQAARILGANRLVPITFAHIDACFYTGQAHVDFARFILKNGGRLRVPTWTNNGVISLDDPELRPRTDDPETVNGASELMRLYQELGCKPTWTCSPYHLPGGPAFGDHIAVGESNAVTYYNSVLGARTNKYGDYLDVACALTGLAPLAGLHTDAGRRAQLLFRCDGLPESWKRQDLFYHLIGHHVGRLAGRRIPVITGLSSAATKDDLKAVSTAVAASGGVEMWHGVGVTPEAPDLVSVFDDGERHDVTAGDLSCAHAELSTAADGPLDAVALGTPHFSISEFSTLLRLLDGRTIKQGLQCYVSTSRGVRSLLSANGGLDRLDSAGIKIPVDVCTYYAPRIRGIRGRVMTNAAKWAYYAPGQLGVEVAFGSLRECVESAVRGEVWRDPDLWNVA